MVSIAPFDVVTLTSVLTGGVLSADRALVLSQGSAQDTAAKRIQEVFSQRIADAQAARNDNSAAIATLGLVNKQTHLIASKERVGNALAVLSKSLVQIAYIKSHVDHLQDQIDELELGNITASAMAELLDDRIRKINILAREAGVTFTDGGISFVKNLINARSRTNYTTQDLLAPYNSNGDTYLIDGVYLGTDYLITEDGTGDLFLSDTGYLDTEAETGTLTGYTSFDDTTNGDASAVADLSLTSLTTSTGVIEFTSAGTGTVNGVLTKGGLGILDAWLYEDFGTADGISRAKEDLEAAESLLLLTEASYRGVQATLESRVGLFDAQIEGLATEIASRIEEINSEKDADLFAARLEFAIAAFEFTLLASRGNLLIRTMLLSQDNATEYDTTKTGAAVSGALFTITA